MGWFTRTHPLQLPSGRILAPMYSDGYSFGIMAISDDGGYTWTGSEPIVGAGSIQPSVVRKNDGTLVAYLRDNGPPPKRVHTSTSKDDGVSWTFGSGHRHPEPGHQPRNDPSEQRPLDHGLQRSGTGPVLLAAGLSEDEGAHVGRRHLDGRPDDRATASITTPPSCSPDGAIHVTYSYFTPEGKSIKHARFNEDWVKAGDPRVTPAR